MPLTPKPRPTITTPPHPHHDGAPRHGVPPHGVGPYGVVTIATGNPGKVAELRPIFAELGIGVTGLADLGTPTTEPAETGDSFEANATIKAMSYARQTGTVCLADDSGLEVDALGGAPGVVSSHYSTDGRDDPRPRAERDAANNARLLRELADVPAEARTARFVCVMVLANPDGEVLATSRGTFEGRIGTEARGENGFGYDPLFLVAPGFARTSAEMAADEKNATSHRAKAAQEIAQAIAGLPR